MPAATLASSRLNRIVLKRIKGGRDRLEVLDVMSSVLQARERAVWSMVYGIWDMGRLQHTKAIQNVAAKQTLSKCGQPYFSKAQNVHSVLLVSCSRALWCAGAS